MAFNVSCSHRLVKDLYLLITDEASCIFICFQFIRLFSIITELINNNARYNTHHNNSNEKVV